MIDIVLSIVMLTALALLAGAAVLWRRTGEVKQPALMVVLAVIAVLNVLIWTVPAGDGEAPLEKLDAAAGKARAPASPRRWPITRGVAR